ncbi:MAG: hypothetical protein LKJ44_05285 [Bifidobacteriaceae bacterium]|jgi:hypothetical protein|nr:hypothetical protein [Bifidobacteriaceae bacterium]MCI1979110.1 hypothetical protein [Bifidobacteriaceae bacterium]
MASKKKVSAKSAQMEKIYRRRRLVVLSILIVALAALITLTWGVVRGVASVGGAVENYMHRDELTALNRKEVPRTLLNKGISDCTAEQISVALSTSSSSVTSGGTLKFTAEIAHSGNTSCLVDGSDASRVLTISSGDETIWTSALCSTGARLLLMSEGDKDIQTLTWDTTASGSKCGKKASTPAAAGTYRAKLTMRDLPGVESKEITFKVVAAPETSDDSDSDDAESKDSGSKDDGGDTSDSGTTTSDDSKSADSDKTDKSSKSNKSSISDKSDKSDSDATSTKASKKASTDASASKDAG